MFVPFDEAIGRDAYVFLECEKYPSNVYLWNAGNRILIEFGHGVAAMNEIQSIPYRELNYRKIERPEIVINCK
jgi:hypothetical protein